MPEPPDQRVSPAQIHNHLITVARHVSPPLARSLAELGPVTFPVHQESTVGRFIARTVVGQQLSTRIARRLWAQVVETNRERKSQLPATFTKASLQRLRNCGLSTNKARALIALGQAARNGQLTDTRLQVMTHSERTSELVRLFGVGPWTCDMVSIFYFRCEDVWPEGDATIQKLFHRFIGQRIQPRIADQFAPYRSYLALSIWELANRESSD